MDLLSVSGISPVVQRIQCHGTVNGPEDRGEPYQKKKEKK
jgi:hypothetical protein